MKRKNKRDYSSRRTIEDRKKIEEHQKERFSINMSSLEGFKRLLNTNDPDNWWKVIDKIGMEYQYNRHMDPPDNNSYMKDPELRKDVFHRCIHLLRLRDERDKERVLYMLRQNDDAQHPKWLPDFIDCAFFVSGFKYRDEFTNCLYIIERTLEKWDAKYPYPESLHTLYTFVLSDLEETASIESAVAALSFLNASPFPLFRLKVRLLWQEIFTMDWKHVSALAEVIREKCSHHTSNDLESRASIEESCRQLHRYILPLFFYEDIFHSIYFNHYCPHLPVEKVNAILEQKRLEFEELNIRDKITNLGIVAHEDLRDIPTVERFFNYYLSYDRLMLDSKDELENDRKEAENIFYIVTNFSEKDEQYYAEFKTEDRFELFLQEKHRAMTRNLFRIKTGAIYKSVFRNLKKRVWSSDSFRQRVILEIFRLERYFFIADLPTEDNAVRAVRWQIIFQDRAKQEKICFQKIRAGLLSSSFEQRKILLEIIATIDWQMEPELFQILRAHWFTLQSTEEKILVLNCFREELYWSSERLEDFKEMYLLEKDESVSEMIREKIRVIKYLRKNRFKKR